MFYLKPLQTILPFGRNFFPKDNGEKYYPFHDLYQKTEEGCINIYENEQEITLHVLAPGVKKEDISITLKNRELTIAWSKKLEIANDKKLTPIYQEIALDENFQQVLELNSFVHEDSIKASCENGLLTIALIKSDEKDLKKITVE